LALIKSIIDEELKFLSESGGADDIEQKESSRLISLCFLFLANYFVDVDTNTEHFISNGILETCIKSIILPIDLKYGSFFFFLYSISNLYSKEN